LFSSGEKNGCSRTPAGGVAGVGRKEVNSMKVKVLIVLVLLALLVIILFQNTQEVIFRIFFWKISMSQVILVPLAIFLGFLFGYFVGRADRQRKKTPV
jgi:uncharacterized integral membrane protein